MLVIIGWIGVTSAVLGGYMLAGGYLAPLWQPAELVIIGGAAFFAFLVSNSPKVIKSTMATLPSCFKGSKYTKEMYLELLSLLYDLLAKVRKEGLMSIESDVEAPDQSPLFTKYPVILEDHHAMDFLVDYLRLMVKTMGSVGAPPAVLGEKIGAALVGTFLGILLAYGFVSPLSSLLEQKLSEQTKMLQCIKVTLLASLNGYPPQVAVEFGRKVLYSTERPSFSELEEEVKRRKGK